MPTAQSSAATAVGTAQEASTTAAEKSGRPRRDPTQLWSVMPVVDFAVDRASAADRKSFAVERTVRATALPGQGGTASSNSFRSSIDSYFGPRPPMMSSTGLRPSADLCPNPRVLPAKSSTNTRPNLTDPPMRAPPPPSTPAVVRVSSASLPAFREGPKAVLAAPRPSSSASQPPATPVGGGQFVPQSRDRFPAASSSLLLLLFGP